MSKNMSIEKKKFQCTLFKGHLKKKIRGGGGGGGVGGRSQNPGDTSLNKTRYTYISTILNLYCTDDCNDSTFLFYSINLPLIVAICMPVQLYCYNSKKGTQC